MKLDPKVRSKLEAERYEAVDDLWIAHLEQTPDDLEFFLPVVRALLHRGENARTALLLQLWLDALRERLDAAAFLASVRAMLVEWPDQEELRAALIDALQRRYGTRPNFDLLMHHFGVARAGDPARAVSSLETWLRYDVGQLVASPKLGVGRVSKVNLALESLRVEFGASEQSFKLGEAQQLLEPLDEDHFLARKHTDRDTLAGLAADDPGELLRLLFHSLGSPLPVATVREHVSDLLREKGWAAWWKRARADGRLTVGSGARATATWSDSAAEAHDQLLEQFERAADSDKLDLVRQHAGRSPEAKHALTLGLSRLAQARVRRPAIVLEAALLLDELHADETTPTPDGDSAWDPAATRALLEKRLRNDDAPEQIAALRDARARVRAVRWLCEIHDDPAPMLGELLALEGDARTLSTVYASLAEHDSNGILERCIRETLSAPTRAPRFYVWLCREMSRREELGEYADWRFLRALVDACDTEALKGQRAALRELFEPRGLVVRCVEKLDRAQAESLLRILEREMGVEEHRKDNVRRAVWARFPKLEPRDTEDEPIYVTPEALETKRAEFEQIVRVDIPRNTEEIRKAAAHGDLRENFEYKAARERQEMLSSRAQSIHEQLRLARVLEPDGIDPNAVRVGTRVRLDALDDGASRTLTILGPWDSDPASDVVSYLAPAVAELLGKRVGETVRFSDRDFRIGSIEIWRR